MVVFVMYHCNRATKIVRKICSPQCTIKQWFKKFIELGIHESEIPLVGLKFSILHSAETTVAKLIDGV